MKLSREQAVVPLQRVEVEATLQDLLVEVVQIQTYRNVENEPIEAVFTFPVPRDALLLDVELALGERCLRGRVVARDAARERYEDAITDGDTAVLLEELEPGLYHLSLGNLQPGETAVLRYRYAQLLHWQGGLRFALPTALAPRYGDPAASGLDPAQVPEVDLMASYPFTFRMRVEGRLAAAKVDSPTHAIHVKGGEGALEITLAGCRDTLDRDLVLQFALSGPLPPAAVTVRDGDRWVALAMLPLPEAGDHEDQAPRCIPILVDCSGSMQGDSIAQARKALGRILDALRPQDHFNIIRFGSHIEPLFPAPRAASKEALDSARALLLHLDADLGGTKIGQALTAAFSARPNGFAVQDLLLITDGEVWNAPEFVERARASGDRVFTVGVGSAVSEAFLRELAEKTGGACELVTPREDIEASIERHFRRIYQKRLEA
ncbi:MAG: VWA domain-containing protein, partial [Gammaproteobacteria bacterium]